MFVMFLCNLLLNFFKKWVMRSGISSRRSRKWRQAYFYDLQPVVKVLPKLTSLNFSSRFWFVAVITRTSTLTGGGITPPFHILYPATPAGLCSCVPGDASPISAKKRCRYPPSGNPAYSIMGSAGKKRPFDVSEEFAPRRCSDEAEQFYLPNGLPLRSPL